MDKVREKNNKFIQLMTVFSCLNTKNLALRGKRKIHVMKALYHYRKVQYLVSFLLMRKSIQRTLWTWYRTSTFWEKDVGVNGSKKLKEDFRMTPKVFKILCEKLQEMKKQVTNYRKSIPLEKRLALALYTPASSGKNRTTANLFGVGKSTVHGILIEFCKKVVEILQKDYLNDLPLSEESINDCRSGFERMGLPQCLGALDGSHIEVSPPIDEAHEYYNYKGWYSVVLLALVDFKYRFMYINVGAPGRCNDSLIFEKSSLKKYLTNTRILRSKTKNINGVEIPMFLIGDSAFRLSEYLLKPFPFDCERTIQEANFKKNLSKCRRVVENAFGHLKARFRRLGRELRNNIKNVNLIIKACCILHNFLISENDVVPREWIRELQEFTHREQPISTTLIGDNNISGIQMRNTLCEFLSNDTGVDEDAEIEDKLEVEGVDGEICI